MPSSRTSYKYVLWVLLAIGLATILYAIANAFLGTLVIALFFYYAARPLNQQLTRILPTRTLPSLISLLVLIGPVVFLLLYAAAIGSHELSRVVTDSRYDHVLKTIEPVIHQTNIPTFRATPRDVFLNPQSFISTNGVGLTKALFDLAVKYAGSVTTVLLNIFVLFTTSFYLLRDDDRLAAFFHSLFGDYDTAVTYVRAVDRDFHHVFFGNVLNAVFTGLIGVVAFTVLPSVLEPPAAGIGYPVLIGLLAGIASLIPVIGMKLVYIPVSGWLFFNAIVSGDAAAFNFAIAFTLMSAVVVDFIPDLFLRPFVSGQRMHVGSLMLAYMIGPMFFGWYGLFLAPMLLVVLTHFLTIVVPEFTSDTNHRLSDF